MKVINAWETLFTCTLYEATGYCTGVDEWLTQRFAGLRYQPNNRIYESEKVGRSSSHAFIFSSNNCCSASDLVSDSAFS